MNLSIIIPLYNEEKLISILLDKLVNLDLPSFVKSREIIIVDDCSKDSSVNSVEKFIEGKKDFQLFKHEINKGKGAAVRTGFSKAKGDVFLVQDADLELSPDDIPAMLTAMNYLNLGFINGSRYLPGLIRPLSSFGRYAGNRVFTLLASFLMNVKISDLACGYKLIKRDLYEQLDLKENRFGFEAELFIKAMRVKKNNIAEVPVNYFPRTSDEGKKLRNIDGFKILGVILKYGIFKSK